MASFKLYFNPNNVKKDGRFIIYIKLHHLGKQAYINTKLTASEKDLNKDRTLKQTALKPAFRFLEIIEERYKEIAVIADQFDAKKLADKLQDKASANDRLDFYLFIERIIEERKEEGRKGTGASFITLLNSLKRYRPVMYVDEITYERIIDYEKFLRQGGEKELIKGNRYAYFERIKKPLSNNSVITYMSRFSQMYLEMSRRYSDNPCFNCKSPWLNYSAGIIKDTESRALSVETLRKIIRYDGELRYPLGKDLFLISLFFCGINMADIFYSARIKDGRLEYNRVKTRRGRSDDAFSSILIQPEAKYLINKYVKDDRFVFPGYTNSHSFDYILRVGLDELAEKLGIKETLIYYNARHSVATIMSNDLDIPDSHIKMALNHKSNLGITGKYIKKDFSKIDRANRKFLDYLFADEYEDLI